MEVGGVEGNGGGEFVEGFDFLIVRDENGGVFDLFKFLAWNDAQSGAKFLVGGGGGGGWSGEELISGGGGDHRWVIVVSIIVRKIIKIFGKPMEWMGCALEFVLNLLSLNGNFLGLLNRFLHGTVVMPKRGSETFISAIGHLDSRIDLFDVKTLSTQPEFEDKKWQLELGSRALMDLCMMASKLAYENAKVVRNVVDLHWKMHFVGFYNCWNDYQKEQSTQVFVACDKPKDANLIIVSFRGTEPFDADDWITDFDYSWYEIPNLGKVHMGFLEALGLGSRAKTSTFLEHLQPQNAGPSNGIKKQTNSDNPDEAVVPVMREMTAYYTVRSKLKELIKEHENAKFVVTGHSLGGALAILFPTVLVLHDEAELMQRLLGVYTFGQPRVGNRQLGSYMEAHLEHPQKKYFRVVYCNDLVPRLPYDNKTFLYKHFGACLYYNSLYVEKNVDEEPNRNFGLWYLIPAAYANAAWEMLRGFLIGYIYGPGFTECWESIMLRVVGLAIPGLSAHSPVDYVNSIRLGRMDEGPEMMSL
ncbi:triacylglycerol lipase OBL1 isoform X2 [Andrographis paniculata]|uniref:triacylglycerol lipase OBL1 isoform X2 n=1 Tax=Andrographis paniculata TaxID=175694 RepID=UPI0021E74A63|nr:triacylglycerol lipase OBL1 isoform X2 [Andrographis paniculata]